MKLQYEKLIAGIMERQAENVDGIEFLGSRNLSSWREFRNSGPEGRDDMTQPEIDALICKKVNGQRFTPLHAIEFKAFYFRQDKARPNQSYYAGLDQAPALLNFGIDYVTLLQCFIFDFQDFNTRRDIFELQQDNFIRFTEPIRHLIKTLNLPLGYIAAFTFSQNGVISQDAKVEILDLKSVPDTFVIRAKRNKIDDWNQIIREVILKKLSIIDDDSMITGPLLM